jgi:hypothetical protein
MRRTLLWTVPHRNIFNICLRVEADLIFIGLPCIRPAINSEGTREPNTTKESPSPASGCPGPASPALDREVVHTEANVGKEDSNGRAEEDIESMVPIIHPPRRRNKAGRGRGYKCEDHHKDRGRRAARANRRMIIAKALSLDWVVRQIRKRDGKLRGQPECEVAQAGKRNCERYGSVSVLVNIRGSGHTG